MKGYTTKPIDFTGCHPVIAEALKRGKTIECKVWDNKKCESRVGFVVGFSASNARPYRCDKQGISIYRHAEPIPRGGPDDDPGKGLLWEGCRDALGDEEAAPWDIVVAVIDP